MSKNPSKKKEIIDYIFEYTTSNEAKEIIDSSKIINKGGFDLWSLKKLMFLDFYIKLHLQILENKGYKCIFLDLFSSCGANECKDTKAIGSPIISLLKGVIPNKIKKINKSWD